MGKSKKAKIAGRERSEHRNHFCPTCKHKTKPTMVWPGRRIEFHCDNGHATPKGATIKSYEVSLEAST